MSQNDELYHPEEAPDFQYEPGDCVRYLYEDEGYYHVQRRYWNYDPHTDDRVPNLRAHREYRIGRVDGLGYPNEIVNEYELDEHYERVSEEEAKQVLVSDSGGVEDR